MPRNKPTITGQPKICHRPAEGIWATNDYQGYSRIYGYVETQSIASRVPYFDGPNVPVLITSRLPLRRSPTWPHHNATWPVQTNVRLNPYTTTPPVPAQYLQTILKSGTAFFPRISVNYPDLFGFKYKCGQVNVQFSDEFTNWTGTVRLSLASPAVENQQTTVAKQSTTQAEIHSGP